MIKLIVRFQFLTNLGIIIIILLYRPNRNIFAIPLTVSILKAAAGERLGKLNLEADRIIPLILNSYECEKSLYNWQFLQVRS